MVFISSIVLETSRLRPQNQNEKSGIGRRGSRHSNSFRGRSATPHRLRDRGRSVDAAREELRKTEPKSARLLFPVLSLISHDCLSNAQYQIVEERPEDEEGDSEQKKFWFDYENRGENGHEKTEPDGKRGICSIGWWVFTFQ